MKLSGCWFIADKTVQMNNYNNNDLLSEWRWWNWCADSLSLGLWTDGRKLVSYFSSGLHFGPGAAGAICPPVRLWHLSILASSDLCLLLSLCLSLFLSLSLSQPFPFDTFVLNRYFSTTLVKRGLHFSTPHFNVRHRTALTDPSRSLLSRSLAVIFFYFFGCKKRWRLLFFCKLGNSLFYTLNGRHVVGHLAEQCTRGTSGGWIPVFCHTERICHQ